jgi:hypothetical protein
MGLSLLLNCKNSLCILINTIDNLITCQIYVLSRFSVTCVFIFIIEFLRAKDFNSYVKLIDVFSFMTHAFSCKLEIFAISSQDHYVLPNFPYRNFIGLAPTFRSISILVNFV